MEQYGFILGIALLLVVSLCMWALGAKANASVRKFREDEHESFMGRKQK